MSSSFTVSHRQVFAIAVWGATLPLGNAELLIAIRSFFVARGVLQAAHYPALAKRPFAPH